MNPETWMNIADALSEYLIAAANLDRAMRRLDAGIPDEAWRYLRTVARFVARGDEALVTVDWPPVEADS